MRLDSDSNNLDKDVEAIDTEELPVKRMVSPLQQAKVIITYV